MKIIDNYNFNIAKNNKNSRVHTLENTNFTSVTEYNAYIANFLKTNKTSVDIFIFDNRYIEVYSDYLQNLKLLFTEEHLNKYISNKESNSYDNHLYSFSLFNDYSVLYSNKELMNRYGKRVPETWDELIETAQYIIDQEGGDVIGYAGLMPSDDTCLDSFYEYLYSFRNSKNDTFPDYRSDNAISSLEKIAEMKKKISSDEIFKLNSTELFNYMDTKKILFSKNWYKEKYREKYYITALPGKKKDISGSTFKGYSIGVNKYIDNDKKQSAKETIQYLSSEEGQMNITRDLGVFCGMDKVYYDESFCKNDAQEFCDIFKKLQIVIRPYSLTNDYDDYSNKVIQYIHKFLYKDESSTISANETLAKIDDITKVYYIESTSFLGNFMLGSNSYPSHYVYIILYYIQL